jgi:hypothetical protein
LSFTKKLPSFNLKTAVEPRRRGEHQVKQGKTKQFDFTFWVNCGAVEKPYCVKRLASFETSTAESRFKDVQAFNAKTRRKTKDFG